MNYLALQIGVTCVAEKNNSIQELYVGGINDHCSKDLGHNKQRHSQMVRLATNLKDNLVSISLDKMSAVKLRVTNIPGLIGSST